MPRGDGGRPIIAHLPHHQANRLNAGSLAHNDRRAGTLTRRPPYL